jgi:hypothetical protein
MLIDSGFITSSLRISGSYTQTGNAVITGSLVVTQGFTGSLFGTASWATNVISASIAANAVTASRALNANTASFATSAANATSASFATSAASATSASIATNAVTASRALNANTASFASFAITASISNNAVTASRALNANTASFATSAANATSASIAANAVTASRALNANTASFATSAASATSASFAPTATNVYIQGGNSFGATALLGTNDAQNLQLETNGTVRMTISSAGNVGIGVTIPVTQLHLSGAADIRMTNNTNSSGFDIGLLGGNLDANAYIYQRANASLIFGTNNTETIRILSNGNVGIGQTSPTSKLDVNGIIFAGSNSSTEGTIILQDQYAFGHLTNIGTNRSSGGVVIGYGVIPSAGTTNAFSSSTSISLERAALSFDDSFRWYTGGAQTVAIGATATLTQKMVLTNGGNLGINQTTPTTARLVIGGTAGQEGLDLSTADQYANLRVLRNSLSSIDKDMYIGYQSGVGSKLHLYSNDIETITVSGSKVGIGTTTPSTKLTIVGNGTGQALIGDLFGSGNYTGIALNNSIVAAEYNFLSSPTDTTLYINRPTAGAIRFREQNADQMFIATGGNVGINTTSPATKLDVQGDGVKLRLSTATNPTTYNFEIESRFDSADTINFYGTSGNNLLKYIFNTNALNLQPAGGSVGIGTTTPTEKLHVVGGNIKVNNSFAAYFGDSANNNGGRIYIPAASNEFVIDQANNASLLLVTNGGTRMTILGGGNIGIGTTSPSEELHVFGNANTGISIRVENPNTGSSAFSTIQLGPAIGGSPNRWLNMGYGSVGVADAGVFQPTGSFIVNYGNGGLNFLTTGSNAGLSHIKFFTSGSQNGIERMRIEEAGNVGIGLGSTAASAKLHVSGTIKTDQPLGGTTAAGSYRWGSTVVTSGLTLLTTRYIEVDIDGTIRKVALVS